LRTSIAAALFLMPVCVAAQSRGRIAVFSTELELVKVPVSIADQAGHNVRDLTEADFELKENGKAQRIQLFARAFDEGQNDHLALDLAILFDTSESMLEVLKLSQQAATRFLESVPRARDLLVVFFDQDIRISRYQSEQQQGLFARILKAETHGNTALRDAIAHSLSRMREGPGRFAMVVFSDGEDTFSRVSTDELIRLVRSHSVTIYPIMFAGKPTSKESAGRARAFLADLADQTGGRLFSVMQANDLPDIYQAILNDLEGQYILGFISNDTRQDGSYRKLKIEVTRKDVKLRHREGYTAPNVPTSR